MIQTDRHLVPSQVNNIMQGMIVGSLGLVDAKGVPLPNAPSAVRIGWPTGGAPSWAITDDICFILATEDDDDYNLLREVSEIDNDPPTTITEQTTYTSVWAIHLCLYGPNSSDIARRIKSSLFQQSTHDVLAGNNPYGGVLYLITNVPRPIRAPELFAGEWWERVDFTFRLNESVIENSVVNAVKSAEVKVYNEDSLLIDNPVVDINVVGG